VLDRFDFVIGTVTNSPDNGLRACFQGVDLATGLQNGTVLGATNNAKVTYAHPVTTGWKSTDFGETVTVTRGQLIACVIEWAGAFTASDSVAITQFNVIGGSATLAFPYGLSVTGTKQTSALPIIGLHYTDGYAVVSEHVPAITTHAAVAYNVDTGTADEWGLRFQVPFPCRLDGLGLEGFFPVAGADFEVVLYDSADVVLSTLTHDGNVSGAASAGGQQFGLAAAADLTANVPYRVTIRPTTTANVTMAYFTFQSANLMDTMPGGQNFYMTSRLNQAGAWTDYNAGTFRRPRISLHFTAFEDGVSAGGGSIFGGLVVR
jgi:hypothetical protein